MSVFYQLEMGKSTQKTHALIFFCILNPVGKPDEKAMEKYGGTVPSYPLQSFTKKRILEYQPDFSLTNSI